MGHVVAPETKNHTKFYCSSRIDHIKNIVFKVRVTNEANDDAYMVLHGECLSFSETCERIICPFKLFIKFSDLKLR